MSLQLKSRKTMGINRKAVTFFAVIALIMQPVVSVFTGANANALSNGPFNLETVCQAEKVVLNLQTKQEVANWITGNVYYKTSFGQESHSLPRGDSDVWSVASNQTEITAGTASVRITGLYLFGTYDKTFSLNYAAINCDTTAPNAPEFNLSAAGQPLVSGQSTDSATVTGSWTKGSDDAVKYEYAYWNAISGNKYKENNPWSTFVSEQYYAGSFTEGEGVHFMKVRAYDKANNVSPWSNVFKVTYDNANPVVTVKSDSKGAAPYFQQVSFKLFDTNMVDKVSINGIEKNLTDNKYSDINNVKPGIYGAVEGKNTLVVYDVADRTTMYEFVLDTTKPKVTVKNGSDTIGTSPYRKVSFKLYDVNKIDKAEVNGKIIPLTDNVWSDLNNITAGGSMGGKAGNNVVRVYDVAGNVTEVQFILDNSVALTIASPLTTNTLSPTLRGTATWNIDGVPAVGVRVDLTLNNTVYTTFTDNEGVWTFDEILPLENNTEYPYIVTAAFNGVSGTGSGAIRVQLDATPVVLSAQSSRTVIASATQRPVISAFTAASTDEVEIAQDTSTQEVLGAQTQKPTANVDTAAVAGTATQSGNAFNFWWIIAVLAAIGAFWWIIAVLRRKRAGQEA